MNTNKKVSASARALEEMLLTEGDAKAVGRDEAESILDYALIIKEFAERVIDGVNYE